VDRPEGEEKAIFIAALDRGPGAERSAFLDVACGDRAELRSRVEALLAALDRADEVLGPAETRPVEPVTVATSDPPEATVSAGINTTGADAKRPAPDDATRDHATAPVTQGATVGPADGRSSHGLFRGAAVRYFGDYEIEAELGRGGMGVVYRARQVSLNRPVALKMLKTGILAGDAELRRFQNEAEAVALLDHSGIVPVYEVGEHDGQKYFSMKLVPGSNLAERLTRYKADPRASANLVAEVAEAVHHAHMRGILHRDLKPANILVDPEGHPQVTDFGLAKRVQEDFELTQSGAVLGTPGYMSPEQAAGRRGTITTATDVYGLGTVLYALFTGSAPFTGDSMVETLTKVKEQPPVPPRKHYPRLPRDLEVICLKCLEKDPRRRYSGAQALADDLRAWLDGRPIAARPVGSLERAALFARRKPVVAAAYGLTAAVIFLVGFGGTIARLWRAAEDARAEAVKARDGEKTQRLAAEAARDREKSARDRLAVVEYGRTMEVAHQEWREGNVGATLRLIETTPTSQRGWEWRYVNRLCHADLLTLRGHVGVVTSACYSTDGSRIVTASVDKTARIWDARTGALILILKGHTNQLKHASYSPDGSRIVTASWDKTAKIWDARTGVEILALIGHEKGLETASFSPDGSKLITAGGDKSVRVWDANTGVVLLAIKGLSNIAFSASFDPDGTRIVTTCGDDHPARIWDAKTGAEVLKLKSHADRVFSASYSPDGSRLITGHTGGTVRIWDARTGAEILTIKGELDGQSVSFSPDGSRVLTNWENTAKVWDAGTGFEVLSLKGHTSYVVSASFSPDGSRIVTASQDFTAKVWDASTRAEFRSLDADSQGLQSASFSPDGTRVITAGWDKTAKIWDATTGRLTLTLKGHEDGVGAEFSPDGSRIVTQSNDKTAKVWDSATGVVLLTLYGHSDCLNHASYNPDGSRIVTASRDRSAKVWDAMTGAESLTLKGHGDEVYSASFSPDGSRILTGSFDGTARIWDALTGREILSLKGHTGYVNSASFNPDGSRVVTAGHDATARVWDARTGFEILALKGHTFPVTMASFSPDGSRIVTASMDHAVKLWDAANGTEVLSLSVDKDLIVGKELIVGVAFSPDGSRIVTASHDGTARIWDARPFVAAGTDRPTKSR
jgi:eukaryotic-like serine/threonine-protein kinase